jgi:hypothetical protein
MPRPAPVMNQTLLSAIFFSPFFLLLCGEEATEATEGLLGPAFRKVP